MSELFETLLQLIQVLTRLAMELLEQSLTHALLLAWLAVALCGINWKKMWPVLATGAWAPGVLLLLISAVVWASLVPEPCTCLGFMTVPNFWWQLGAVGLVAALTLVCGWLQGVLGWTPPEIDLTPPPPGHGHDLH